MGKIKKIEVLDCYLAKVNYHRTDDLKEGSCPNGIYVCVQAGWIIEEDQPFAGDWAFTVAGYRYWLPERDLILTNEIPSDYYHQVNIEGIRNEIQSQA